MQWYLLVFGGVGLVCLLWRLIERALTESWGEENEKRHREQREYEKRVQMERQEREQRERERAEKAEKEKQERIAQSKMKWEAYRLAQEREYAERIRDKDYLRGLAPAEFERLCCRLMRKEGYQVRATPASGDHGVDAFLERGGRTAVLQCKRYNDTVGEPIIRELFGTMHGEGADEAILATTGELSLAAQTWIQGKPIRVIEEEELGRLVRKHFGAAGARRIDTT